MKIIIGSLFHRSEYQGGNEVYTHELAMALVEEKIQVLYLSSSNVNEKLSYEHKKFNFIGLVNKPIFSQNINYLIRNFRPDVLHFTGSGLPLVISSGLSKLFEKITTIHTYQAPSNPDSLIRKLGALTEQTLISKSFDGIITTTPTINQFVKEKFPNIKTIFIPMSLKSVFLENHKSQINSKKHLRLSNEKKYILFIGKLDSDHYYKGLETLVTCLNNLAENYQLIIVGDGNKRNYYENLVINLGIQNQVSFVGEVNDQQLCEYYRACDVFVLPSNSNSEGFGLVLIEAMAFGLPVITTNVIGSFKWFSQEKVANFVSPNNPDLLAKAITKSINNPDREMIIRAKKFALTFSAKDMAKRTIEFYKEISASN